jgi:hypothetical protein
MERHYKWKAQDIRISCPDEINWDGEIKFDPGMRKEKGINMISKR